MSDSLVKALNALGYLPVLLPRTGIAPPELYTFANHRLIRHGALKNYLPDTKLPKLRRGKLGDIEARQTSKKSADAALAFLRSALSVIGITGAPKLDLSFTGAREFVASFTNVTYESLDPAELEPLLPKLSLPAAISNDTIDDGDVHIAYEYAYANTLHISRADSQNFAGDATAELNKFIDLHGKAQVAIEGQRTIMFSANGGDSAAFAYKAGQLHRDQGAWIFQPETTRRALAAEPEKFLPAVGAVLRVEEA